MPSIVPPLLSSIAALCRSARLFAAVLFLFKASSCPLNASPGPQAGAEPFARRPLKAQRLPEGVKPPTIDGDITDTAWKYATPAENFIDQTTDKPAAEQTVAALMYDKQYLYVCFRCYDRQPAAIVARETIRDADMSNDDVVRVVLDTFTNYNWEDQSRFAVNPLGTRGARLGGGRAGKLEWQGDWEAAAKRLPDGWSAEMRIPWAILPYPRRHGHVAMGVNFERQQQRTRVFSRWSDLGPQGRNEREGVWDGVEPPTQAWKPRFSVLPYLLPTGIVSGGTNQVRAGLDARYQPTPDLVGVATINPDFQSVEGAVESIGFTRGEQYVPDHRPFFLEGQDYFNVGQFYQLGSYFDSTRIARLDTGVKLYGKLTPQTTIGMLGTVFVGHEANFISQVKHDFGPEASTQAMLIQRLGPGEDNTVAVGSASKRWHKWSIDGQAAQSAGPGAGGMAYTTAANLEDKNFFTTFRYRRVGSTFLDQLGYVPFVDYQGFSNHTEHWGEFRKGFVRSAGMNLDVTYEHHLNGAPFRRQMFFGGGIDTRNDYHFDAFVGGGKFDYQTDFTYGFSIGGNVSNRFRQWGFSFTTGEQANLPYTSYGPRFSVRLFKKFDLNVSSFMQCYQGFGQQHIVTFNYEITPYRSWGGRMVIQNADLNVFLSFKNAGRGGMDTYLILGDPNAVRISKRVMMKFVFAI